MTRWRNIWIGAIGLGMTMLLGGVAVAQAQTATVRGTVSDSANLLPLAGAEVTVVGTAARTSVRANGQYILSNLTPGSLTIQVRMIGYRSVRRTLTVADGEESVADFTLTSQPISLEDIVVIGYGTALRSELSTAISSVNSKALEGITVASPDAALQGRAPGVEITENAGNPGNGITVRIRGTSSLSASSQPLFVIDGVPMISEDISSLDLGGQSITAVTGISPSDIASMDILKDAAAAAIYGSRGSNGVIIITTKRGRPGKGQLTLDSYFGTQAASRRLGLLNSTQYLQFFNESAENDGYGADFYGVVGVDDQVNTDWQNEVLRHAPIGNTELAVSGGDDRMQYRVSGNWFDQTGIVIGSGYRRLGGRANLDFNAGQRLNFSTSLSIAGERNDRIENDGSASGIITNAVGNAPLYPVRHDGDFTGVGGSFPDGLQYPNSVALATLNTAQARTLRTLGNVESRFSVRSNLLLTSRLGVDLYDVRENQFESPRVSGTYPASSGGVAKSGYSSFNKYVLDNFLTFNPGLSSTQSLTVTAGNSLELNRSEFNFIRGEGLTNDRFTQVHNATKIISGDASTGRSNLISFFSRASYSLKSKYLAAASLRADGSSKFATNNKWGVFPAISAAWVMSEESFLSRSRWMDNLKLRASFGLTGNQSISDFPWQGTFGTANYGDSGGTAPTRLANPDLKWESTSQFDIGIDADLFGERVNLSVDYYRKHTQDLLLELPITSTAGFSSIISNAGAIQNNGIEVALTTINKQSDRPGGFHWSTTFNFAANRNRVTDLANNSPVTGGIRSINRVEVGQPIGAFYTLKFLGVDPDSGNAIYEDVNNDGVIDSGDRQIVGSPFPDFTGGFINDMSVGRFSLSTFFTFSVGADVFNAMRIFSDAGGWYTDNQFSNVMNRWQKPGDVTDVPRASYDGTSGAREISSRFIEDGSYLRLKEVSLGYELPERLSGWLGMSRAHVYVSGRNLFTITGYTGYSPEVNSNGSNNRIELGTDFYAYPIARTFTFGIQAGW
ncbi:MAG: TonB-dependent receptor [Gemmatimonadota bacterium]